MSHLFKGGLWQMQFPANEIESTTNTSKFAICTHKKLYWKTNVIFTNRLMKASPLYIWLIACLCLCCRKPFIIVSPTWIIVSSRELIFSLITSQLAKAQTHKWALRRQAEQLKWNGKYERMKHTRDSFAVRSVTV